MTNTMKNRSKSRPKAAIKFRAFMVDGIIHGGGGCQFGNWRKTFAEADNDRSTLRTGYCDSLIGVEAATVITA